MSDEKRKKVATRQSLSTQVKDLQRLTFELFEHVQNLENQQVQMYVELTALKQFSAEGRPVTAEAFDKRCEVIYKAWAEKVPADESPVSESGPAGSDTPAESVVAEPHEVPVGDGIDLSV